MDRLPRKKRRLNYDKCRFCRASKKKCERDGEWPSRCKWCIDNDLPCAENERALGSPPLRQDVAGAGNLEKQCDLTLRIAWLRRLRLYVRSAQAIRDSWETLFGQSYTPQIMKDLMGRLDSDENSVAVGIAASLLELPSSSNHPSSLSTPLPLSFLLNIDSHRFQSDPTYRQISLKSVDVIDRTRNVNDAGLALMVQEFRLVDLLCSHNPNEEVVATELRRYYDVHRKCSSHWEATYGFNAASGMPLLHCLFLLTKGKGFLLLITDSSHLVERDMFQRSIIHLALDLGAEEAALHLLNKFVAGEDVFGRSPIHLACLRGSEAIASLLSQHKADLGSTDYLGRRALHYASASGRAAIAKLLLQNGADVKSSDDHGRTPLMLAIDNRHSATASLLLQSSDNMEAPDGLGEMPLGKPVQSTHETTAGFQLETGAATDSTDKVLLTPLWKAGAGHLLDWPCVNEMLHDLLDREGIRHRTEFPIRMEEERGLLLARSQDSRAPILNQSGPADFSEHKVWTYVESFEQNIHIMHPIILPKKLRDMVRSFLDSIPKQSEDFATTARLVPHSIQQVAIKFPETRWRRLTGPDMTDHPQMQHQAGRPADTISNAVVLTVLALGKICLHRDSIPDIVYDTDRQDQGIRHGDPSSAHASSLETYPPNAASPSRSMKTTEGDPTSCHQQSCQGNSGSSIRPKYDAVPGLEYFMMATDIIRYHLGDNTLNYVYANLFAGLYHGQLGRVVESHAYIADGCTTLMNILRPSLKRLSALGSTDKPSLDDNHLLFAFWTGLQLESDIIAEIPRHHSSILTLKHDLPYPHAGLWLETWLQGDPSATLADGVIDSYTAQLYLRRHLNWIHGEIYTNNTSPVDPTDLLCKINNVQEPVADMKWVPDTHRFTENDPPATDILSARFRAKYWGLQVITYRPCIKLILDLSYNLRRDEAGRLDPRAKLYQELQPATIHHVEYLPHGVWEYARKGIRALTESTRAFHGLGAKRPIITNVFGTAHAQWGNLVVLAACYRDPFLRIGVDGDMLRDLFVRTIYFLRQVSTPNSALRVDQRLLEGICDKLFPTSSKIWAGVL